ncbi:MAG: hypothetical protein KDA45_02880 [Planctomycetales bacterium]|nr:hypothetical protein [Planctomycetales bacterium]
MRSLPFSPLGVVVLLLLSFSLHAMAIAGEPQWTHRVIKLGEDRQQSNSTDILLRPYRPLHVYGNTVRRLHYRGQALPSLGDVGRTVVQLVSREEQ